MEKNTAEVANRALDIVEKSGAAIHDTVAQLAASLGVAAEHVYMVLVRQQVVSGAVTVAFSVAAAIAMYFLVKCWLAKCMEWKDSRNEELVVLSGVPMVVVGAILVIGIYCDLYTAIMKIANPEYYAMIEAANMAGKILGK